MSNVEPGRALKAEVFKTVDGATLVGQLFHPTGSPKGVLLLNGATGVAQKYYWHFATYAAQTHGLVVFTYDYRDMGKSAGGSIRQSRASMSDWGLTDQQTARAKVRTLFPDLPLHVMGHSLGSMTMPLQRDTDGIAQLTCVASGSVHHSDHPWPYRAVAWFFWFGMGPIATAVMGYLPGRALGLGADLPARAYWQWRRWCTSMKTFGGEEGRSLPDPRWDQPETKLRFFAFSDDDLIPPHCVVRLAQDYGKDQSAVQVIDPTSLGLRSIGHLGAFARRNADIWDTLIAGESARNAW